MEYQPNPVDIETFLPYFLSRNPTLKDCRFTGFRQTETRWRATFQDDDACIEFQGPLSVLRGHIEEYYNKGRKRRHRK